MRGWIHSLKPGLAGTCLGAILKEVRTVMGFGAKKVSENLAYRNICLRFL